MSKNKYMTEQPSNYDGLEKMDTLELLTNINHALSLSDANASDADLHAFRWRR